MAINTLNSERFCPVCDNQSQIHFADERIDSAKINNFTYASRKQPEFMCLRLVRCTDCDLVYAPTPPTHDFLLNAYSEAAYDSAPEAQAAADSYAKVLKPYVNRLKGRNAAVDVGAGSGPLLPWLCECGFNPVVGIEPSREAIQTAPEAIQAMLREGLFSEKLLADLNPSLICSFMTLEHVANPSEFVQQAYRLLEPGGMLAVVVHNWQAPLNRILGLRSPIIDVEHLQLFNPLSMSTLLKKVGFESIEIRPIANRYPLRYWLRLMPLPTGLKARLSSILEFLHLSNKQISLRVGNLLAIAIKPLEKPQ